MNSVMQREPFHNLPNIDIPKLSGKYTDWEDFRDLFLSLVHKRKGIEDIHRFHFLRLNVSNKALEIVKKYSLAEHNYKAAWKDLAAYYANPRRLVNLHLSELFNVKPMKNEHSASLNTLMREIKAPLEALKSMKRPTEQWSDMIVYLTTSRFDSNTLKDWQRFQAHSTDPPTVEQLEKFTNSQIAFLEALEAGAKGASSNAHSA